MTKFQKWFIFLSIILVLGLFYWFQIRPAQITARCTQIAQDSAKNNALQYLKDQGKFKRGDYEFYYSTCLNEKGLK